MRCGYWLAIVLVLLGGGAAQAKDTIIHIPESARNTVIVVPGEAMAGAYKAGAISTVILQNGAPVSQNNGLWINPGNLTVTPGTAVSTQGGSVLDCSVTTTNPTYTNAQFNYVNCDAAGNLRMVAMLRDSGGTDISDPAVHALRTEDFPGTTNGCTPYHLLSTASTNATNIKPTAGTLCSVVVINPTSTVYDLRFYDSAAAPPTCSSATGVVLNLPVPASTTGSGFVIPWHHGQKFVSGIGFCLTGAVADNDNTAAAAGVAINLGYN